MSTTDLADLALTVTNDLPIRHQGEVHNGKVRSVYWLTSADSRRLVEREGYPVHHDAQLGVMITSDRISAFDVVWQAAEGLMGVPGKGAALNASSNYWFKRLQEAGIANHHLLDTPHPQVWLVQKAEPIKIEAVGREYLDGSIWRVYEKGTREFCGIKLPDGLKRYHRLEQLIITPTTKGTLQIPGIPQEEDAKITREQIEENFRAFGFQSVEDVALYETLSAKAFDLISTELKKRGYLFLDTKFEFGYVKRLNGDLEIRFIDEAGTPDSSRIVDKGYYELGQIAGYSKEPFRQFLLDTFGRKSEDVLLNDARMEERRELALTYRVPPDEFRQVAEIYKAIAEAITGEDMLSPDSPREKIMEVLSARYGIIQ